MTNKRLVFLQRAGYVKPLQGLPEFLGEQDAESVREQNQKFDNFHGYNITGDQALENGRLGVREDLYHAIGRIQPGRDAGLSIIDERINQELRSRLTRERGLDIQRRGWFRSRWRAGRGFFANVRNLVRTNSGIIDRSMEETYGRNETTEGRSRHVAVQFLNSISVAQGIQVEQFLIGQGVPVPPNVPPGHARRIMIIGAAEPEMLHTMRTQLNFLPARRLDPIYPTNMPVPPATLLDRLIELKEMEGTQKEKAYSTTVYDATRLNHFLDDLRRTNQPIYERLTNKILKPHSLYPLENNAEAQVLVAYLEQRIRDRGAQDLDTELINIENNRLPSVDEKREEGKEPSDELLQQERVQELTKSIAEMHTNLGEKYNETESTGAQLWNLARHQQELLDRQAAAQAQAQANAHGQHQNIQQIDLGVKEIGTEIIAMEKAKAKLQTETNNIERKFLQNSQELMNMLTTRFALPVPPANPDPVANLRTFNGLFVTQANLQVSNEEQLFGVNFANQNARPVRQGSQLEENINDFSPSRMKEMGKEIKKEYHKHFKKKEKINCRQLATLLKEGDYIRQGVTNPELARRRGLEWTNVRIARVQNQQMYRQTNQELAEYLGETTLGSRGLNRLIKRAKARMTSGTTIFGGLAKTGVLEARDVIDYVAGFDKEFHAFRGMPKDVTLSELRDRIEGAGGISNAKLFEFAEKMRQVYMQFEMLNSGGKVELLDGDAMDMERLIENLLVVREELNCRQFFEELRPGVDDKGEAMLKRMSLHYETMNQEEKGILATLADKGAEWKQMFSKRFLKSKFLDPLRNLRKLKKEQKLSYGEFTEKLKEGGLSTAFDMLKYGLVVEEGYEVAKAVARWTGGKTKNASEKLSRAPNFIWETGKAAVVAPVKFIGKAAAFPFKLASKAGKGVWSWLKPTK